jgi:hypothetical protein
VLVDGTGCCCWWWRGAGWVWYRAVVIVCRHSACGKFGLMRKNLVGVCTHLTYCKLVALNVTKNKVALRVTVDLSFQSCSSRRRFGLVVVVVVVTVR